MRYFLPILGLVILVAGLAGVKFAQISMLINFGKAAEAAGPPPEAVSSSTARALSWEGSLSAVGSVVAEKGVAVSNDAPGVVTKISFESGASVKQGQVLLELDTSVERAQLASAQVRKKLAEQNVARTRALFQTSTVAQAKVDADEAQLQAAQTELSGLQAQINRKVVRAAFAGRLGIRNVNLGQYLAPGTPITTLEALDAVFVDFTLPQQMLPDLAPGLTVRISIEGAKDITAEGQVVAVDPSIDESTRSIKVRARVPNAEQKLRPGMFADVSLVLPKRDDIVAVPQTAVVHAPYGDSVFVIEAPKPNKDGKLPGPPGVPVKVARQQFVRVGEARGDFVSVLEGVTPGQEVVTAGAFKLRNNATVVVNNNIKVEPKVDPKPENR